MPLNYSNKIREIFIYLHIFVQKNKLFYCTSYQSGWFFKQIFFKLLKFLVVLRNKLFVKIFVKRLKTNTVIHLLNVKLNRHFADASIYD